MQEILTNKNVRRNTDDSRLHILGHTNYKAYRLKRYPKFDMSVIQCELQLGLEINIHPKMLYGK